MSADDRSAGPKTGATSSRSSLPITAGTVTGRVKDRVTKDRDTKDKDTKDKDTKDKDTKDKDTKAGVTIPGIVVAGHGVASGRSPTSPFTAGTISMQRPFFAALGLDLSGLHAATINVDISPMQIEMLNPAHTFEDVRWTQVHAGETFSFATCELSIPQRNANYTGWVYYPHPDTKPMHEQPATVIEVVMPHIAGLGYGDRVTITVAAGEIRMVEPPPRSSRAHARVDDGGDGDDDHAGDGSRPGLPLS